MNPPDQCKIQHEANIHVHQKEKGNENDNLFIITLYMVI
jgi:hypothetical protein